MSKYGNTNGVNVSAGRTGGGISLFSVVGIVFLILKLTGNITWSWWLVLLPFYGPVALCLAGAAVCGVLYLLFTGLANLLDKKK